MGDNANIDRQWHNHEVGKGYQAPGVVRQRNVSNQMIKVIDMRNPQELKQKEDEIEPKKKMARKEELKSEKKEKKIKKERTTKKEKMEKKSKKHKHAEFNPFLQVLACRLSNTTREFTISNGY